MNVLGILCLPFLSTNVGFQNCSTDVVHDGVDGARGGGRNEKITLSCAYADVPIKPAVHTPSDTHSPSLQPFVRIRHKFRPFAKPVVLMEVALPVCPTCSMQWPSVEIFKRGSVRDGSHCNRPNPVGPPTDNSSTSPTVPCPAIIPSKVE